MCLRWVLGKRPEGGMFDGPGAHVHMQWHKKAQECFGAHAKAAPAFSPGCRNTPKRAISII